MDVSIETAIDQLIYARQREWQRFVGHDKLKLRDLIIETIKPYLVQLKDENTAQRVMLPILTLRNAAKKVPGWKTPEERAQSEEIVQWLNDLADEHKEEGA